MRNTYKIIGTDGREYGPATLEEIRDWIVDGRVAQSTLVWRSDDSLWTAAGMRQELRWDLPAPPPLEKKHTGDTTFFPGCPIETAPGAPPVESVRRAGFFPRFVAYIFDLFLLILLLNLILMPWHDWFDAVRIQVKSVNLDALAQDSEKILEFYKLVLPPLFTQITAFALLSLVYYVGFHSTLGFTPGKFFSGIRVESEDGLPLRVSHAFVRYSAECLSWVVLGLGYLMILTDPSKRALHDRLARTRVVYRN